jgi:hypothetical protein
VHSQEEWLLIAFFRRLVDNKLVLQLTVVMPYGKCTKFNKHIMSNYEVSLNAITSAIDCLYERLNPAKQIFGSTSLPLLGE